MYLFNNVVMPDHGATIVVHSQNIATVASLVVVEYHLSRHIINFLLLEGQAKVVTQLADQAVFHADVNIVGQVIELLVYLLLVLTGVLVVAPRVLVFAHH